MQVKLLPGQGLTLTTLGVWGKAATRGGIAAGAEAVGWGLAGGAGFAEGEPDGPGDPEGLDAGLPAGLAAGLEGAPLGVVLVAGLEGGRDAAPAGVGATGGYVKPPPPPFVQPASRATTIPAAANRPTT